jgi:hypothetical protein
MWHVRPKRFHEDFVTHARDAIRNHYAASNLS